jgi:hypothetical protein
MQRRGFPREGGWAAYAVLLARPCKGLLAHQDFCLGSLSAAKLDNLRGTATTCTPTLTYALAVVSGSSGRARAV